MSGWVGLTGPDGITPQGIGYTLASNITLAAGQSTTSVTGVQRASYILDVSGTFASGANVQLQVLGSDGTTWRNAGAAVTTAGTVATAITAAANSFVRLTNTGTASVTGLYATFG